MVPPASSQPQNGPRKVGLVNPMCVLTLFSNEAQPLQLLLTIQPQSLLGPIHCGELVDVLGPLPTTELPALPTQAKCALIVPLGPYAGRVCSLQVAAPRPSPPRTE